MMHNNELVCGVIWAVIFAALSLPWTCAIIGRTVGKFFSSSASFIRSLEITVEDVYGLQEPDRLQESIKPMSPPPPPRTYNTAGDFIGPRSRDDGRKMRRLKSGAVISEPIEERKWVESRTLSEALDVAKFSVAEFKNAISKANGDRQCGMLTEKNR